MVFGLKNIKSIILALVIAIVVASLVGYLIEVFDESPKWEDYCKDIRGPKFFEEGKQVIDTESSCVAGGGVWVNNYCDYYKVCQEEFNNANKKHSLVVFSVAVPLGIVALIIGLILALPSVSSGLMLGGVF